MDRQVWAFTLAILLSIVSSQIPQQSSTNTESDATFLSAMKNLIWGPNPDNATQMDPSKFHQYSSARSPSSTLLTSASVSVSGAACTLPQQIGTGPYRIPRWYYNPARQRCELFYWSGCCGNQNNFQTFQSCQQVCEESPNPCAVQTTGPLVTCLGGNSCGSGYYCHSGAAQTTQVCCPKPSTLDRCQQPLNIGIGNEDLQRWYFNPLTQQCQTCVYKGLQGNENNFVSRNDCENACVVNPCRVGTPFRSQGVTVQCSAMNPTVCPAGYYCHIGADQSTSLCCQALGGDPCGQPMDRGTGGAQLQRWYWNVNQQCCLPFSYCGLKGTQNNFLSRTDCERTCYELDNPCAGGEPLLGQDNRPLQCPAPDAPVCGNANWCHIGGSQQTTVCCPNRVNGEEICQLPLVEGDGEFQLDRFYFDSTTRQCLPFIYKGRLGNQNNFLTQEACENLCPVFVNVCPMGQPLLDSSNRPIPCTFGSDSCGDHHWCHLGLVPDEYQCCPGTPTYPGACQGGPFIVGNISDRAPPAQRWYYDKTQMKCLTATYNGRAGSQNNFLTQEDCEATCEVYESPCNLPISLPATSCQSDNMCGPSQYCHFGLVQDTTVCCPSEGDACSLPLNRGQGQGSAQRWYYDQNSYSCLPFQYAGTKGNSNNFLTQQACEERCGPNPCFEGRPFQGADGRTQTCTASASINTCPASYWCHVGADMSLTVCCPGASTNVCNLPMSTGEGNYNLDRYYFDSTSRTCRPFKYNGLKGNQNNFLTLRSCQLSCQPLDNPCIGQPAVTAAGQVLFCSATNKDACPINFYCHIGATPETTVCCPGATNPCSVPLAPGTGIAGLPRYYYNPDDRQCEPFTYNGKRGNQNNFLSQAECERTCPEELCLLSIDRGACANRVSRYAFDRQTNQCIAFEYTGCGGNLNNFASYEDCESTCAKVRFRR